jgi:hypothetical protein
MGKVELSLQEYNDLVETTAIALNQKLELKKQVADLTNRCIELVAQYLEREATVWTHAMKEEEPITEKNIRDYIAYSTWESKKFTPNELLLGARYLYDKKFNKR